MVEWIVVGTMEERRWLRLRGCHPYMGLLVSDLGRLARKVGRR
jgi:hypothetical protein